MAVLIPFLWACTANKGTASADTAAVAECTDESIEGSYTTGYDSCLQAEPLEEQCATSPFFDGWWEEDGCPSFTRYATYALNNPIFDNGIFSASRCDANGIPYDVITYDELCLDDCSGWMVWIFDVSGKMLSQREHPGYVETRYCCEEHSVYYYAWGEQISPACVDAPYYTADDFPDSADTATDMGTIDNTGTDTATTDTADTADTADTGAQ